VITDVLLATRLSAKFRGQAIYKDQMYGLCNGLDIHALYYNKTILEQYGLQPPQTISNLDEIANALAPFDPTDWGCTSMDGQRCPTLRLGQSCRLPKRRSIAARQDVPLAPSGRSRNVGALYRHTGWPMESSKFSGVYPKP
jgi:hypothetical protein